MKRYIIATVCMCIIITACSDFAEMNTNPNATERVTPGLIATGLIMDIMPRGGTGKNFASPALMSKHLAWGEKMESLQYNYVSRSGFGGYSTIIDAMKMQEMASGVDKEAYMALAYFIKAYKLFYISIDMGDIPYSDALQGESGNMTPKYDTQKQVMINVLADFAAAEQHFAAATVNFVGDPLFDGDVSLWRKFANAMQLRVLMYLSQKVDDQDLKIAETFEEIVKNHPLLESNADNMQLVYSNKAGQIYPFDRSVNSFHFHGIVTSTIIDILKGLNDYRLFYYASPSQYSIETLGLQDDDWEAYPGVDPSIPFEQIAAIFTANQHCALNERYTNYFQGEPLLRFSYAEQNFIIAEAIVRGWLTGDAAQYYYAGIGAAMEFIAINTPNERRFNHGRPITHEYVMQYIVSDPVKFADTPNEQLKQIWTQKYIHYFMQNPWEAYYEHRRTNYPEWPVNPLTNQNSENPNGFPKRWMYPQKEYDTNLENLKEALDRQYGGLDRVNDIMWILK